MHIFHKIYRWWTKGCILPFPKKGNLGLAKIYRGITLTFIAAKIYNALLWNRIEPKIEKIFRKNQNGFWRNRPTTTQILTICRILEDVRAKNLEATILFVDFSKAFDSILRGKMEQILLPYGLSKETIAAIMILYRNTKIKVCLGLHVNAHKTEYMCFNETGDISTLNGSSLKQVEIDWDNWSHVYSAWRLNTPRSTMITAPNGAF